MRSLIFYFGHFYLLLLLITKDKNGGEKELFKEQKWKGIDVAIVVTSYISLELFMKMLFSITGFKSIDKQILQLVLPKNQLILYTILYNLILLIILIAIFKLRFKQGISALGIKKKDLIKNIELGLVFPFIYLIVFFILLLIRGPNINIYETEPIKQIKNLTNILDYAVYFVFIVILGPILEEIIHRGVLYSPYRKKYGPKKAIIITSLIFTIGHIRSGPMFLVFIDGIIMGILYERTESLVSTMVFHGTRNLTSILGSYYLYLYY